jgi:phosphatidylglycerophosphate synthase
MRPLTRPLTRLLLPTPVTPNQVTLVALLCGVAAAVSAARGEAALAGILFWIGAAVDCVDGDLARLRVQGSRLGEWLDTLADDVSTLGLLLGLGVELAAEGYGQTWLLLGIVGVLFGLLTEAKLYLDLHRLGLPIDTAQYPWFFGSPGERRGPLGRTFYALSFLFRRDAFVTLVAILLIGGARRVPFLVLFGGAMVFAGMLAIHMWVTRRRHPGGILATNK